MDYDFLSMDYLWKSIIRPKKEEYSLKDLPPKEFMSYGRNYIRKDYRIIGYAGHILQCSFYEYDTNSEESKTLPVIIFCHGNSSSQLEIKYYMNEILKEDINIFAFDFSACGRSEGDYISLGFYEKKDLEIVINFVQKLPNVGSIGLWGHSMGASTILMYAPQDPRIACVCVDSPFSALNKLLKEISQKEIPLPEFIYSGIYYFIRKKIINNNNVDIDEINPIRDVKKIGIPIYFVHAMKDELINCDHSSKLYKACKSSCKYIHICEGGHNSIRPEYLINKIIDFFKKFLFKDIYKL